MPSEISKYLYTDEEMRPVFSKMARSFNYAEVGDRYIVFGIFELKIFVGIVDIY